MHLLTFYIKPPYKMWIHFLVNARNSAHSFINVFGFVTTSLLTLQLHFIKNQLNPDQSRSKIEKAVTESLYSSKTSEILRYHDSAAKDLIILNWHWYKSQNWIFVWLKATIKDTKSSIWVSKIMFVGQSVIMTACCLLHCVFR